MTPTRREVLGALGALGAGSLAGCAGNGGNQATTTTQRTTTTQQTPTTQEPTATTQPTATQPTTTAASATVAVRTHSELGDILVDGDGRTLYMFDSDTQGEAASTCYDACAGRWPPLIDENPTAGGGVTAGLSAFDRTDGSSQVAANGWPLYYFALDSEPGDAKGQGIGDVWWVLDSAGQPIRGSSPTTTTSSGGGGGYEY